MSFGMGTQVDVGWGNPDSWGGPDNGIDLIGQTGLAGQVKASYRMSEDGYLALIIIVSLVVLWLAGGIVFKHVRI